MENIKKHMDVTFVRSRNVLRKHCAKNSFQGVRRISSSVCMVFSKPDSIVLSKFPWIGVAILDIRYVQKTFLKVGKKIKKKTTFMLQQMVYAWKLVQQNQAFTWS